MTSNISDTDEPSVDVLVIGAGPSGAVVTHTAAMLATLKGVSNEELARTTTDNFFRLFSKVQRPAA